MRAAIVSFHFFIAATGTTTGEYLTASRHRGRYSRGLLRNYLNLLSRQDGEWASKGLPASLQQLIKGAGGGGGGADEQRLLV